MVCHSIELRVRIKTINTLADKEFAPENFELVSLFPC